MSSGLAAALDELHSQSAMHQNLCPEHVLLKFVIPSVVVVKLCGLGSSCICDTQFECEIFLA